MLKLKLISVILFIFVINILNLDILINYFFFQNLQKKFIDVFIFLKS